MPAPPCPGPPNMPFASPRDFEVVGHIFSHLRVEPRLDGFLARRAEVGEQGLAIGYLLGTACPIHHIMKELMPLEPFFYALHDYPEKVHRLAEQIEPFYQRIQEIGAESPAEVLLLGGNYDDSITYPNFFEKYIFPALHDYAEVLHRRGQIPDDPHRRREPAAFLPLPARRIRYR